VNGASKTTNSISIVAKEYSIYIIPCYLRKEKPVCWLIGLSVSSVSKIVIDNFLWYLWKQ